MDPIEKIIGQKLVQLTQDNFLGPVSIATILLLMFFFLYQKLVISYFDKKLERFNLEQAKLLEEHRHELNKRFDRISSFHEKEFKILPEIWLRIQRSFDQLKDEIEENNIFSQKVNCEKSSEAESSFREFCRYFYDNKVIIDDELSELLTKLEKELSDVHSRRNLPGKNL